MANTGRFDQRKKPEAPAQQGPEEVGAEHEAPGVEDTTQETSRAHHQMGNAALAAMIGSRSSIGGAGLEVDPVRQHDQEIEGPGLGGDDDPVEVGPLTEVDLATSWSPSRRQPRRKDKPAERFREPMPTDDLPPEDEAFVRRLRGLPAPDAVEEIAGPDPMVQPSIHAATTALGAWAVAAGRFAGGEPVDRALTYAVERRPPALQDAEGRVLVGATRVATIASWGLLSGPTLGRNPSPATCALVHFCLELEARQALARDVVLGFAPAAGEVPSGAKVFAAEIDTPTGGVRPGRLAPDALRALATSVSALQDLDDPNRLVPHLVAPVAETPPDDDDDPLGLDAFLAAQTGGAPDPLAAVYTGARLAAERLAGAATATAIHGAAAALAVRDVAWQWSAGAPDATLLEALSLVDRDVREVLKLLVEIARACQSRSVAPNGVQNGLKRAARMTIRARTRAIGMLSEIIAGLLPPGAVVTPARVPDDPLTEALSHRDAAAATDWLARQPTTPAQQAALAWVLLASGASPASVVDPIRRAFATCRDAHAMRHAGALSTALCAALLRTGSADEATAVATWQLGLGRRRRNGLVAADASLTLIEAATLRGDAEGAEHARLTGGAILWHMGAVGPLALLTRWRAEPEDRS
jgi:hypothetical protein